MALKVPSWASFVCASVKAFNKIGSDVVVVSVITVLEHESCDVELLVTGSHSKNQVTFAGRKKITCIIYQHGEYTVYKENK